MIQIMGDIRTNGINGSVNGVNLKASCKNGYILNNHSVETLAVSTYVDLHDRKSFDVNEEYFKEIMKILMGYVKSLFNPDTKVVGHTNPMELKAELEHMLAIPQEPIKLDEIIACCEKTVSNVVKTGHLHFFNQLFGGLDVVALSGEMLASAVNASMYTFEVGSVFSLMEDELLRKMRKFVGWEGGDGIFSPGGTVSNMYAVQLARHAASPNVKHTGLFNHKPMTIYCNKNAHYSIRQAAAMCGIGVDNVRSINADNRGRMDMVELDNTIIQDLKDGYHPIMVCATSGSTVLGSFDRIDDAANVCQKHKIWLHVDGAYGGGVLLSQKHRYLMRGSEKADSLTWNPHKLMSSIQQCSVFLSKHQNLLLQCNSMKADYLFQQDKHYDTSFDTGDKSIQCGRRNDAFRLWLMWKSKGDTGFEKSIDNLLSLSKYFQEKIKNRPGYEMIMPEFEFTNVGFWYLPPQFRNLEGDSKIEALNKIAPKIKHEMMKEGSLMIGYQPLDGLPNFFRIAILNSNNNFSDMDFVIEEIERLSANITSY